MVAPNESSELGVLLGKLALEGKLSRSECVRAVYLVRDPDYFEGDCTACKNTVGAISPAIYDTHLCKEHALYVLATGN